MIYEIKIETPRGFVAQNENGTVKLIWKDGFGAEMTDKFNKAQKFVDSECLRRCSPLVPLRSSMLIKSGQLSTVIGSGEIIYSAPYARKQYFENKGTGERGKLWFERMKAKDGAQILAGAKRLVGAK